MKPKKKKKKKKKKKTVFFFKPWVFSNSGSKSEEFKLK